MLAAFLLAEPDSHPTFAAVLAVLPWAVITAWSLTLWLIWHIWRHPGHLVWRRLLAMIADNMSVGMLMLAGGATMLPVYVGLLWITVGFGMRYGPRYLLLAIGMALVTCSVNAAFNPYWRDNPAIPLTLMLGLCVTPTYAFFLHARLRRAQLASEAASVAKSRFLSQVSHDLRQPLHAVGLITSRIATADTVDERRDIARRIDRSIHDARELLQTFLDTSIIESGRLEARPTAFPLALLLNELEQVNREAAGWNNVRLRVAATQAWIVADRAFVRTIMQNLIANAIRVSAGGSVLIGAKRQSGGIAVGVIDNGPGLDPLLQPGVKMRTRERDQLFDVRSGGMGLGLSIVWQLASQHGVDVRVSGMGGRGTRFSVGPFPLTTRPAQQGGAGGQATPLAGRRIALIGGTPADRAALKSLVEGWGCIVVSADTRADHSDLADLLIIDAGPVDEVAAVVQGAGNTPLVILTSHPLEDVRRSLGAGRAIVAAKPVTAAELRSLLMAALVRAV